MPELPEVETIRLGLCKVICGKKITDFEKRDPKVVQFEPKDIEGYQITKIERQAKILIFHLSHHVISTAVEKSSRNKKISPPPAGSRDDKALLVHLKMTGQLIWEADPGNKNFQLKKSRVVPQRGITLRVTGGHPSPDWVAKLPNAYTRAILHFDDGSVLFFNDLRRFGYMKLYDLSVISNGSEKSHGRKDLSPPSPTANGGFGMARDDISKIPELAKLGPEPFSKEFNVEYLMRRAAKIPNRKIKQFITDQEIISGVGNIYVDEALFYAKISPLRLVKDLKLSEWKKIRDSIIKALEMGLKFGGSSEDTYVDAFGNQGEMNQHTKVYRHTGADCPDSCGGTIKRITLGGRGTHYCPDCQK